MLRKYQNGFFSLVGLIVVVIVIGGLFIMSVNYYRKSGAEKTVNQVTSDAINASLQTDLQAAAIQLKVFLAQNNTYPTDNDCSSEPAEGTVCLKVSNLNKYVYEVNNEVYPPTFSLIAYNKNGSSYKITQDNQITKISDSN